MYENNLNIHEDSRKVIGWIDKVDFPQLQLYDIDAKVDTGAWSSSLHCHNIVLIERRKRLHIRFNMLDPTHPAYNDKEFTLPVSSVKRVRNSFGQSEDRYFIRTDIVIFDKKYRIELSLRDRGNMNYPVLLGRRLLRKNFIVDVSGENLSYEEKNARKINEDSYIIKKR
jgi:hypothetical protein